MNLYSSNADLDSHVSAKIKRANQRSFDHLKFHDHMNSTTYGIINTLINLMSEDRNYNMTDTSSVDIITQTVRIYDEPDANTFEGMMNLVICFSAWSYIVHLERGKSVRNCITVSEIYKRLLETINNVRYNTYKNGGGVMNGGVFDNIAGEYLPQFALQLIVKFLSTGNIFVKWIDTIHTIDKIVNDEKTGRDLEKMFCKPNLYQIP